MIVEETIEVLAGMSPIANRGLDTDHFTG